MFDGRICRASTGLIALILVACGQEQGGRRAPTESADLLNAYIVEQTDDPASSVTAERRGELQDQLKRLQAVAAEGRDIPGAAARAEIARLESLANSAAEAAGVFAPPTDAELQQAYLSYLQSLPRSDYHAAHILVASEILANAVIAELDQGKAFAEVARRRSADDTRTNGGDLGWIHPGHLPPEIFEVLVALKPGEYSRMPIHTKYGWHVIRLLDTRAADPKSFEQVKAQLATNLRQERYRTFLEQSTGGTK